MLGNSSLLQKAKIKTLTGADEQMLLLKIVNEYATDSKNIDFLYELLTKSKRINKAKIAVEAQPLTPRKGEGNSYLDLAMGSIKRRENTVSGIELDSGNQNTDFLFCEAKWRSDLSLEVTNCSIRNQLQRIIENALFFAGDDFKGKIFITLITPEIYKNLSIKGMHTRFYSYKYKEYKDNIADTFLKEIEIINSLGTIPYNSHTAKNPMEIIKKNLKKVILNWATFEELIENIPDTQKREKIKEKYTLFNK